MKNKTYIFCVIITAGIFLANCTRNGDATEQSPNMGYENAEGGTTPHVSSAEDSAAKSRSGGASENSGISQPLDSVPSHSTQKY